MTYRTAYAPFTPNNSEQRCPPRITAAAGTELAGASSTGTVIIVPVERSLRPKGLHPPRGVAASGFPPLRKIPTAASRRSLDRVSVPVWPCALSGRLLIVALVGHYPAN